jgi:AP-1 complex subunit mu
MTEVKVLKEYIKTEANKMTKEQQKISNQKISQAMTNVVGWRTEGIKHSKNEIFLDVIEKLNLLVSASGNVLRSEILGTVRMKSFLSGMPELKLGLNDKALFDMTGRTSKGKLIEMEDIKFHQCVRLNKFESERNITFIPPDGEFELMTYRLDT